MYVCIIGFGIVCIIGVVVVVVVVVLVGGSFLRTIYLTRTGDWSLSTNQL